MGANVSVKFENIFLIGGVFLNWEQWGFVEFKMFFFLIKDTNYTIKGMVINTLNTIFFIRGMGINTRDTNYSIVEMAISTQDTNYSIGGMVINTQDTNYSLLHLRDGI